MSVRVTDHALVRFLERGGGLDAEALRRSISASLERAAALASSINASRYTVTVGGLRYVVVDGHLVTVLDGHMRLRPEGDAAAGGPVR
jgi:hypothetical protein